MTRVKIGGQDVEIIGGEIEEVSFSNDAIQIRLKSTGKKEVIRFMPGPIREKIVTRNVLAPCPRRHCGDGHCCPTPHPWGPSWR